MTSADHPVSTLYISDLDGTLLASGGRLSDYSRRGLAEMLADGLPFSVASARSFASIRTVLGGIRLGLPVIELNGAFLTNLVTGRHEVVNSLDSAVAEDVYRAVVEHGCAPLIATFNGTEDRLYHCEAANEGMRWYLDEMKYHKDERLRPAGDMAHALADDVVCITVIGEASHLAEVELMLRERQGSAVEIHLFENLYSRGWYWLTVHDRRATKAQGVRTLAEMYGLSADELVVFGDEINDVKIFEIARLAVAVANAHPTLMRVASHVIGSNDEDSVVRFIQEHWLGKKALRAAAETTSD